MTPGTTAILRVARHGDRYKCAVNVDAYFDDLYRSHDRYWWRGDERYSAAADAYPTSLLTQQTLRLIEGRPPGRALDLGAGEGTDSIRLALLGYEVDAVEVSSVAAGKICSFARAAGARVNVIVADAGTYRPASRYDVVICNGVLHYIEDKEPVLRAMQEATADGGLNVLSLWSTYTPVPGCHQRVPVSCDDENGLVVKAYQGWRKELLYMERDKPEAAHGEMPPHRHSHIKMIARKAP